MNNQYKNINDMAEEDEGGEKNRNKSLNVNNRSKIVFEEYNGEKTNEGKEILGF